MTPDDFATRLDAITTYEQLRSWCGDILASGLLTKDFMCVTTAGRKIWPGSWPATATVIWDQGRNSKVRLAGGEIVGYQGCNRQWIRRIEGE